MPLNTDHTKITQVALKPYTTDDFYDCFLSHFHRLTPFYRKTVWTFNAAVFFFLLLFWLGYPRISTLEVVYVQEEIQS